MSPILVLVVTLTAFSVSDISRGREAGVAFTLGLEFSPHQLLPLSQYARLQSPGCPVARCPCTPLLKYM